jgi:hypothetical protein
MAVIRQNPGRIETVDSLGPSARHSAVMILTILRLHLSLEEDAPTPRAVHDAGLGPVIEVSQVGGLHHHYERRTVWSAVFLSLESQITLQCFDHPNCPLLRTE